MQSQVEKEFENKDMLTILITKLKLYLYERNYKMTSHGRIHYLYAVVLNTIFFIQFYFLISLPAYNQAVSQGSDMYYLVQKGILLLGKSSVGTELNINSISIIVLCGVQVITSLAYLIPVKSYQINTFISKYIIHMFSIIAYIPSVYIATENLLNSQSIQISLITLLLTLINRLMFITMHFQLSIRGVNLNVLIRIPLSISSQLITFFLIILFLLCKSFLYPMSLIIYLVINIMYCLFQVKQYCIGFSYFHQSMTTLMGILKIMKISIFLCYFIIIATEITLVSNNILTFIGAFFVFFAHFFLTFKKYSIKRIVIDSENQDQTKKIIYIIWYFNCFRKRSQKKSQLYLSSLLKNHTSECSDLSCCCQKRDEIYDPSQDAFGSPKSQPHQDLVYIKHFFLKILTETHKSFPKSNDVLFILAFYNLEILHFIPQTIQLIKQLKRKSLKSNLTLSEDYVLYCLGQRCYEKIYEINNFKGNLNLQRVRLFDLKISSLKEAIKFSVDTFSSLWRTICSQRYNQKNLVDICKVALEIMFKIQDSYKEIKAVNSVSTQLKDLMIFYSKSVAHDIHLQSEIRKDIKMDSEKVILSNLTEIKEINIFSPNTITLVTSQISNIRWASKNCYSIFGYNSREEFLKLKINDLMPKFFGQNHDSYIEKWLYTGRTSKLNKCSYLWGSTKDGYCFSMGFYVKIIPLQKQQDFAFFAAIQKIDIYNQIICSQEGQILGSGKFFASTIKCPQKALQQYKMNIQVLLPSTYQIFIDAYFPGKRLTQQLSLQTRYQGYFPKNLQALIKEFSRQKQAFMNKHSRKSNLNELSSNFLKQKMQQITVHMGGQYISMTVTVHELKVLQSENRKIIVLKFAGIKKNNIEKYYNQLQKMITRIEQLIKQSRSERHSKGTKTMTSLKNDFFKAFLNPKRVRRILEKQGEDRGSEGNSTFNRLNAMFPISQKEEQNTLKTINREEQFKQKIIYFRKKLALGRQHEIKGQRAKYNIWKMKKALLTEGVFSRYTYDLLTGNSNNFGSIRHFADQTQKIEQQLPDNRLENENESEDELVSDNLTKRERAQNDDKGPNDKETFNSATSSAAIITMTNSIKMFKMKLRSLNTPKLLYGLNIGLMLLILLISGFKVWLWNQETRETEIGEIFFRKGIESSWAIDSMLMGKVMTQKLVHIKNFSSFFNESQYKSSYKDLQRKLNNNLDRMLAILSAQVLDFPQMNKIDPNILGYLFLTIPLQQTIQNGSIYSLQAIDFIMRELDYAKLGYNEVNPNEVQALLQMHRSIYQSNMYYNNLQGIDQSLYLMGLVAFVLALAVTIPIVYKIQSKVQEIMYLISKISQNQRRRYSLKFTILSEQLKKFNETQSWTELQYIQQTRMINTQMRIGSSIIGDNYQDENVLKNEFISKPPHQATKIKFYQTIYFKITLIYLIYLLVCCTKFIYVKIIFDQYIDQSTVYTNIMSQKLKLTQNSLLFNQFIIYSSNMSTINLNKTQLVSAIYNSYHLTDIDKSDYDNYLLNVTTGNICEIINDEIQMIGDNQFFIKYLKFNSNSELEFCKHLLNGSLMNGLFGTIDYIEQIQSYIINQSLKVREDFLKSMRSVEIQQSLYYANTMCYLLQRQVEFEVQRKKQQLIFLMRLWLIIIGVVIVLFTGAWIFIYLNIAERASYINAFLLLIPYDVLSENPYIKLYIKNQFDYKASVS